MRAVWHVPGLHFETFCHPWAFCVCPGMSLAPSIATARINFAVVEEGLVSLLILCSASTTCETHASHRIIHSHSVDIDGNACTWSPKAFDTRPRQLPHSVSSTWAWYHRCRPAGAARVLELLEVRNGQKIQCYRGHSDSTLHAGQSLKCLKLFKAVVMANSCLSEQLSRSQTAPALCRAPPGVPEANADEYSGCLVYHHASWDDLWWQTAVFSVDSLVRAAVTHQQCKSAHPSCTGTSSTTSGRTKTQQSSFPGLRNSAVNRVLSDFDSRVSVAHLQLASLAQLGCR